VEPDSAVVDEGGSTGVRLGVCCARLSGTVKSILGRGGIGVVRCTPAMSVSSVTGLRAAKYELRGLL
jgi:hypothetical protein